MITAINEEKVLSLFFYRPMSQFGVRELSRETNLDTKTVMKYLNEFVNRKIVIKQHKKGSFPYFEANRLSLTYRFTKGHILLTKIVESGLIQFIEEKCKPKVIVLFGSVAKGTYHEKSDIDLFVQAEDKRIDLSNFERKLGHEISLFFEADFKNLTRGLLANIYNGEVLSGRLEVLS